MNCEIIKKQIPAKKREKYRQKALEVFGKDKAIHFDSEADMRDFRRVVRKMGLKVVSRKEIGWDVWVK